MHKHVPETVLQLIKLNACYVRVTNDCIVDQAGLMNITVVYLVMYSTLSIVIKRIVTIAILGWFK